MLDSVESYDPGPVAKLRMLDTHLGRIHRREATEQSGLDLPKVASLVKQLHDLATTSGVKIDITCEPRHKHPDFRYATVSVFRGGTMPIWSNTIK